MCVDDVDHGPKIFVANHHTFGRSRRPTRVRKEEDIPIDVDVFARDPPHGWGFDDIAESVNAEGVILGGVEGVFLDDDDGIDEGTVSCCLQNPINGCLRTEH